LSAGGYSTGSEATLLTGYRRGGVEEIIVYGLTPEEKAALQRSAKAVRELCDQADRLLNQTK
jgi:malate/lactate dehydrogenase